MDDTFLMGTTSSITRQSLGKIVQRAPAVGAKIVKMSDLGYKFPLRENIWGAQENLNIGAQLETFPLCIGIIIVLKITLLNTVSIFTNSVTRKRDKQKQTNKKHHTFSSTAGVRLTTLTKLHMVIDEVRPIFAPLLLFSILLVVPPLGLLKICGKMPPSRINSYISIVCPVKATNLKM